MNRDLFAFLTANTASRRFVPPSQALALDSSLDRLTDQNRALQKQLATDREVMARALKQQERDQAVQGSLIREARRQDQRANLLATALDDVLRTFTDAKPGTWYEKQLRSWYVKEQQLDDWRALLPASKNRSGWRTDLMARSQYDREVQKARDNADYAQKRSNHLVDVGQQHATELRLRAQAEQQLREVTAERDELAARLRGIEPAHKARLADLARAITEAAARSKQAEEQLAVTERWWQSTIAEARRQATRADAAEQTLNSAYRERARLLAWLVTRHYPAVLAPALDVDEPGWHILFVNADGRQLTWHIHPRDLDLFAAAERVPADDPRAQWDGHTTADKYRRIATLSRGQLRPRAAQTVHEAQLVAQVGRLTIERDEARAEAAVANSRYKAARAVQERLEQSIINVRSVLHQWGWTPGAYTLVASINAALANQDTARWAGPDTQQSIAFTYAGQGVIHRDDLIPAPPLCRCGHGSGDHVMDPNGFAMICTSCTDPEGHARSHRFTATGSSQ